MNSLPIQHFSPFSLPFFRENLDTLLTPQNKKIMAIAGIALACLAALYLLSCCCCDKEHAFLDSDDKPDDKQDQKFEFPDGTVLVGKTDNDYIHKFHGTQTDFDGIIEEGIFDAYPYNRTAKMDLTGQGKRTYPDGAVWEGVFYKGHLNGKGKKALADGTIEEGTFSDDLLTGKGKVAIPKGDTIEGFFKGGKLNGYGKITHDDGTVDEGLFTDGVLTKKKPKPNQSTTTTANAPKVSVKADPFASSPEE